MKKVALIFGGNSPEHNVSCLSAKNIKEHISVKKYDCTMIGIDHNNNWYIFEDNLYHLENDTWLEASIEKIDNVISYLQEFDIVFPIIHGENGEDGKLQGMFDLFSIPYVGCDHISSVIGIDKELSKLICKKIDIPTLPFVTIHYPKINIKKIEQTIFYPVIIKPSKLGSSIGIYKANNRKELLQYIKLAKEFDKKLIIEPFIKVRELECSILQGNKMIVSEVGEITHDNEFYDYETKYHDKNTKMIIPAIISKKQQKQIQQYAKKFFKEIDGKGLSRIDFFLDELDNIYFNEINTLPGFTNNSMYPVLLKHNKLSLSKVITTLLEKY